MGTPAAVGGALVQVPEPKVQKQAGRVSWVNKGLGRGDVAAIGVCPPLGVGTPAIVGGALVQARTA